LEFTSCESVALKKSASVEHQLIPSAD